MSVPHDTEPRRPYDQPLARPTESYTPSSVRPVQAIDAFGEPLDSRNFIDPEAGGDSSGPGCGFMFVIGLLIFGLGAIIIVLGGAAGWASGQRIANTNGTATRMADISIQCGQMPQDVANTNPVLLEARITYLATLTPGVPCLVEVGPTATALFINNQPTATPTVTNTPINTPTTELEITTEPLSAPTEVPTVPSGGFSNIDLNAELESARVAISVRDWQNAIDTLDVIMALDSNFQPGEVRRLMSQALNSYALELYRSGELAQAILLTNRAEEFGPLAEGLNFERLVATRYLDALNTIGTDFGRAIQALNAVRELAPNYRGGEVERLLFEQYVAFGDAYTAESNHCSAQQQYQNALNIRNDVGVAQKLASATTFCENPTPIPAFVGTADPNAPLLTPIPPGQIAPVGVPDG
ncbi:MAG: hypothetical protein D6737_18055 [Chloroflexi bacterium]|nr:MAG: hypothetical protein D6737_18055 [Chloroflexota bacterium]